MGEETVLVDLVTRFVPTSDSVAIRQKGSRRIVVDGLSFRWRVRSRSTRSNGCLSFSLTVAVESEAGGAVLVLVFGGAQTDKPMGASIIVATPGAVASAIRAAVDAGWERSWKGGPAFFGVKTGRLASSIDGVWDPQHDVVARQGDGGGQPYDPEWLVSLAEDQHPDEPWLPRSLAACPLAACRQVWPESKAYFHFVDRATSEWRFQTSIMLKSPEHGPLVLDILEGEIVGGVEFLNRL